MPSWSIEKGLRGLLAEPGWPVSGTVKLTSSFRRSTSAPRSSDGVYAWDGSSWARHLEGQTIYPRLVSDQGAIWAGSASSGVYRHADRGWQAIELPQRLQGAEVFDLAQGTDGSIWLATSAGLGRLARGR